MSALRVLTLNIWNRMGDWDARLVALRHGLKEVSADLVALQEVVVFEGFDQAALLAEDYPYRTFGKHPEGIHPMGNAILSRHPLTAEHVFPLPHGGTDERRTLVHARIAHPTGPIDVFCTHLNWKFDEGHVREEQVRFIADQIDAVAPLDAGRYPALLLGDLNAEPDADEIRFWRGKTSLGRRARVSYVDAYAAVGPPPGDTFSKRNPNAAPLREPERRIDYVFVRGPTGGGRGEPLAARVVFDEPVQGAFASDHFGVTADLTT